MAQVIGGINLSSMDDSVTWTDKITKGYFTGDLGKITAGEIHSASLADTNELYYYGIAKDNTTGSVQFDVAYGSVNGYGSDTDGGGLPGKSKAIYKQWASTLLGPTEVTGGLFISRNNGLDAAPTGSALTATTNTTGKDDHIYVMIAKRALFKDRLNKKNWTVVLSGSESSVNTLHITGSNELKLTDDSATVEATITSAGPRYNIVSGSQGTIAQKASTRTYGWFYPDQGVMIFSGAELSASIPGNFRSASAPAKYNGTAPAGGDAWNGFGNTSNIDQDYNNALRFVNCSRVGASYQQFRSEEDQTSVSYFCRARSGHCNFSNNPTFRSGSYNEIRNKSMRGNPSTYITGVELFDGGGNMVAVGKLSSPLKKNFSSEATIKTKLTF